MKDQAKWMAYGLSLVGTKEIKGPKHNPTILQWVKNLGRYVGIDVKDDETAWCGVFAGEVVQKAGFVPPTLCFRASEWGKFGDPLDEPAYGAILVFTRSGGGHVGFYDSEDASHYHVLGGNQSDQVNITKIAKNRLTAVRWPDGVAKPVTGRVFAKLGGPVSKNEA